MPYTRRMPWQVLDLRSRIPKILCFAFILFLFAAVLQPQPAYAEPGTGRNPNANLRIAPSPPINAEAPMVALTFDDGPNAVYTPQVLDILAKYEISATFFINGMHIERHQDLLKRTVLEGHELADHTYSHYELPFVSQELLEYELAQTQIALSAVLPSYSLHYVRVPYGSFNAQVLASLDRPMVLWDVDPRDWEADTADAIYNAVLPVVADGDVVLFHDTNPRTVAAIDRIIPELLEQGYQLVTLSELEQYRQIDCIYY